MRSDRRKPDPLPRELPAGADWIRRREAFYEQALGPLDEPGVYHWFDDGDPHVDVYRIRPRRPDAGELLITGGMADRPAPGVPAGGALPRRTELLLRLPRAEDWAAMILRELATLPFAFRLPVREGLLVAGSREIREGSRLRHALLGPHDEPALDGFIVDGEEVRFLLVWFVTSGEYLHGLKQGGEALLDLLRRAGVSPVLDLGRDAVV